MSAKRRHRTPNEYMQYLKGELSREERHDLERDLEANPFDKDAMEGFESIAPSELEEDLLSLHSRLRKRHQRRRRMALYSIAATVASILVVGTIFINIYNVNPKARQEPLLEEESFQVEEAPAQSEPSLAETNEPIEESQTEMNQTPGERNAKGPVTSKKSEVSSEKAEVPDEKVELTDEKEEVVVQALDFDMAAPVIAEAAAPAPVYAVAPEAEADAVVAVEAAPRTRQKRAQKAVPQAIQSRTIDQEMASDYLTGRVSGVVVSAEDMDPLPGASVYVKGTDSGIVADMQGRFTVPESEQAQTTVIASYVGMVTDEYHLASGQENRVVMRPDHTTLNEVVVVANEFSRATYPTGAIQKVKMEQQDDFAVYSGAEPAGGLEAYKMYMEENIRFPAGDTISKREVVVLKFKVAQDGTISDILTLRSPGDEFTEEAIRLLMEGPLWKPAQSDSGPIEDEVRMRVVFKK